MHGAFDRSGKNIKPARPKGYSNIGVLALPTLLAIAMIALALSQPAASSWIAPAAEAEFAASILAPEPASTQIAQPAHVIRTVRAN